MQGAGCRVWVLGLWGSRFRLQGSGFCNEKVDEHARNSGVDPYTAHTLRLGLKFWGGEV
jgi:hypothetical protein